VQYLCKTETTGRHVAPLRYNASASGPRPPGPVQSRKLSMRRALLLLPLLALLLAACARPAAESSHGDHAAEADPMTAGTVLEPPAEVADFSMPSSLGRPLGLADLKGKPTLIFFGFTHCPDVCPTTMAEFKRAKDELGPDGERVNFVLVSVDPERDTPEALATYVQAFDPAFIGLQGEEPTLRTIGRTFGLYWEKQPPAADGSYEVEHSSAAYLLDQEGRLSILYSYGTPHTTFAADLRKMLDG
jgi:protein SCO1/2